MRDPPIPYGLLTFPALLDADISAVLSFLRRRGGHPGPLAQL